MITKDYPVLVRFDTRSRMQLILDVKYQNGFYFEQYAIVCASDTGFYHELFKTIHLVQAEEKFEQYCRDSFWSTKE